MFSFKKSKLPEPGQALPGRSEPIWVPDAPHLVTGHSMVPSPGEQLATLGMGCFWGVERLFWQLPGVRSTAAGYAGGETPNPSYEEVCSGATGHTEVVLVMFDESQVDYETILRAFWEGHDPTQGMRQGNDTGTQYRSAIYTHSPEQQAAALASKERYAAELGKAGYGMITTEILPAGPFYYAESYHQQYLAKHPNGYCGLGGTGVNCPGGSKSV